MKTASMTSLLKGVLPLLAVGTCCCAAVALNASQSQELLPLPSAPEATQQQQVRVSETTHFVHMSANGEVVGRLQSAVGQQELSSVNNVEVHFVQNGVAAAVVKPGDEGVFRVSGLEPGRYSVVAAGKDALSAYAVAVLPFDEQAIQTDLTLDSAVIPSQDFKVVTNVLRSEVYSDLCSQYCRGQGNGVPMAPTDVINPTVDPIGDQPLPVEVQEGGQTTKFKTAFQMPTDEMIGQAGVSVQQKPVQLNDSGELTGRIHWLENSAPHQTPAEGARVSFVQNGEVVQVANTNSNGVFTMANLQPGHYSVVATCGAPDMGCQIDAGACCSAVQVVPHTYEPSVCCPQYDACLVGCNDMSYTMDTFCDSACGSGEIVTGEVLPVDPGVGVPVDTGVGGGGGYYGGGGGFGGGFAGGGGGGIGGGGGLLGGLIGAGIGAGIYAAIDDDDDNRRRVQSPASP